MCWTKHTSVLLLRIEQNILLFCYYMLDKIYFYSIITCWTRHTSVLLLRIGQNIFMFCYYMLDKTYFCSVITCWTKHTSVLLLCVGQNVLVKASTFKRKWAGQVVVVGRMVRPGEMSSPPNTCCVSAAACYLKTGLGAQCVLVSVKARCSMRPSTQSSIGVLRTQKNI